MPRAELEPKSIHSLSTFWTLALFFPYGFGGVEECPGIVYKSAAPKRQYVRYSIRGEPCSFLVYHENAFAKRFFFFFFFFFRGKIRRGL